MANSYRPMMIISATETAGNALRFATEDEALANAESLFMRWTVPTGYTSEPSNDPVRHTFIDGKLSTINPLLEQ